MKAKKFYKAVAFAKNIAERKTGEVVVHEENGLTKDLITFTITG